MKVCRLVFMLTILLRFAVSANAGLLTAVDIINPTAGPFSFLGNGTFGWSFTPSADILVTDLGFFDQNANGLAVAHQVGIWDASQNLLASATVPAGVAAPLIDDFRYIAIAPAALSAGQLYVIGATNPFVMGSSGEPMAFTFSNSGALFDPLVVPGERRLASGTGNSLSFPAATGGAGYGFFGPNFEFEPAATVPEPSSLALLSVVGIGAAVWRRRRSVTERSSRPCCSTQTL